MEAKPVVRNGASCQDFGEKTGSHKLLNRKAMTLMNRQYTSLQHETSADKASPDNSNLSRSSSSVTLSAMKVSASVGDFKTRESSRPQTDAQVRREESDTSEVTEKPRSRISGTEGVATQQQKQQQPSVDVSPGNTVKGLENRSPKSNEKDDTFDQLNTANAAAKHRKERFLKNFPDVAVNDELLEYYYCAYSRDILFPGFMYVTHDWICFHSKIMGRKDIRIPVQSIVDIAKARTAKLIPNAISIVTRQERHVFASLVSRDRTHSLLMKIWKPRPKPEDEDSLNGSSQNGERNYANDDISVSSDDVTPSGSDESPFSENRTTSGSRSELIGGSPPDVSLRRHHNNSSSNCLASQDVKEETGDNPDSAPVNNSRHDRRSWRRNVLSQIPPISTTSIILFLTTVLIVFLILSAGMLAIRLIQLQAQMESTLFPLASSHHAKAFLPESEIHDRVSEEIYQLKHEHHLTTIQRLHSLLEVHLKLLDKVNQSLKGLQESARDSCSGIPTADGFSQDTNS